MPSGAISASLSRFKMLMTGYPLIPWSMDESCISWAIVASLISIFTDPPAQHPSKLFKQLGRWKTDGWRKRGFPCCWMLCSQDPWLQPIKQIWDEGGCWQIRELLLRTAGKPQPLSRMATGRCQMCAPTVSLEPFGDWHKAVTRSRLNCDPGIKDSHFRVCVVKGGTPTQQNGRTYLFLDRWVQSHYKSFNNEVSESGDIQSGTTVLEGGKKVIFSS